MNTCSRLIGLLIPLLILAGCISPATQTASPTHNMAAPSATLALNVRASNGDSLDIGSIHPIRGMLLERAAHAATLLQEGKVLITGGFGLGDSSYRDSAELYDPIDGEFTSIGKMAFSRCCHTSTRLPDGRVLIAGGFNGEYLSDAEIYDPKTGTFTPTGSLTTQRMDHIAVLLENGEVLLAGGIGTGWAFLASAELYDPSTGTFTATGDMSIARESHTATKLLDGRVLITGGHRGRHAAIVIYDSAEIYDPASGSFTPTGTMNVPRHKHDAVLLADGRVLVTGGSDEHDDQNAYTSAEVYDPAGGTFSLTSDMPGVRYKHTGTSVLLPNGEALIAGGARNAIIFDPQHNVFDVVPGDVGISALSRLFSTATLLQNGNVLITGGYGVGKNVSANAWLYSP